ALVRTTFHRFAATVSDRDDRSQLIPPDRSQLIPPLLAPPSSHRLSRFQQSATFGRIGLSRWTATGERDKVQAVLRAARRSAPASVSVARMERLFSVEFGPSRSKRFRRALAEAQNEAGECNEVEPGRYRARFVLGEDPGAY